MRQFATISFALAIACWAQSACAASASPTVDTREMLAMEILTVTDAKARILAMSDLMEPNMLKMIAEAHPGLSDKALDALRVAFHEEVQASLNDLMNQVAEIYVRHFTETEMQTVLAFYKTDTGRKLLAEMPNVMKESVELGHAWGQRFGVLAGQRAVARLRSEGFKI